MVSPDAFADKFLGGIISSLLLLERSAGADDLNFLSKISKIESYPLLLGTTCSMLGLIVDKTLLGSESVLLEFTALYDGIL